MREQGHQTLSAATMEQALALLDVTEGIDLLFVDVGLHEHRQVGLDLAQKAVLRTPDIKVLYTTGQTITDGLKALFVEGSALLPKPYTVDQLQTILTVNFGIKPAPPTRDQS